MYNIYMLDFRGVYVVNLPIEHMFVCFCFQRVRENCKASPFCLQQNFGARL